LSDALKSRWLTVNPARGAENLPRRIARRHHYLTAPEVYALAAKAGEHRVLVLVLAFCGLRWGEAIALQVADVELLRRRTPVSSNAVQIASDHEAGATKERRAGSVPIPAFVLEELSPSVSATRRETSSFPLWMAVTYLVRAQAEDGSSAPSTGVDCPRSRRKICDTPVPRWRCQPGPT
jgi:integrase